MNPPLASADGRDRSWTDGAGDEEKLVALARTGDADAFGVLADRYSTRLRRTIYRITRDCDAAFDAVQEALLRAWQGIGRFQGRSRFYTWVTRIGINEAYRGMRRPREERLEDEERIDRDGPQPAQGPDPAAESHEFLEAVEKALGELPSDYRSALKLRDIDGLSTAEAAAELGIGERALKSRLHRGRRALRKKLDHYLAEGYL